MTPAGSSDARRSVRARTAPASSTSRPRPSVACASHSSRVGRRLPVGWNRVPTGSPASAGPAWSAVVSTTGMPAPVAIRAASTLVTMPPVPTPAAPVRPNRTPSRSASPRTSVIAPRARRTRVAVEQAVDVGQQHQQVGVHEVRDQRGQPVVVAEADLGRGDGVVLVHDRHRAELAQPLEGPVGVAVVPAPGHVVDGEQHLAGDQPVPGEPVGVAVHEQALPDAGRRLLGGEVARAPGQPERRQPGGDGARAHQHHVVVAAVGGGQHVDERVEPVGIEPARRSW